MFIKPAQRQFVRNCLLITNIVLSIIFVSLFVFGLAIVRPNLIAQATNEGQYYLLDLNHLPQGLDTIEPDYIGRENNPMKKEPANNLYPRDEMNITSSLQNDRPKIAILITNLGLNKRINDLALKLPSQISFGILPYSNRLQAFVNEAQVKGHEIYISSPNFEVNRGENYQTEISISNNADKLNNLFKAHGKYNGLYSNHTKVIDNREDFQQLLNQMEDRNLIFVFGETSNQPEYTEVLNHRNIMTASIIIDPEADDREISKNLEQLVKDAKNNKKALGYANGYLLTIEMINKWLPTLKSEGIELVPINSLLERAKM